MWVIYSPAIRCVNFIYHKRRSKEAPAIILDSYKGKLQSDGYRIYEIINDQSEDIELSNCNAHARRKFEKALSNDKKSTSKNLTNNGSFGCNAAPTTHNPVRAALLFTSYLHLILHVFESWITSESC